MLFSISPFLGREVQRAFTPPSRQLFAVFLVTCLFSIGVIAHPLGSPAPARQPSTTPPDPDTLGRQLLPASASAPYAIQAHDITLHGHRNDQGEMSVYLTIGADKICRDHDCPASEFSMLLGYAHFKDSITRDDTIKYVRRDLPMAPLDPDASWSYADSVMNILAITPHASGLQHPLSSPITLDTYHSWKEEVLALAKKQSTKITQEQINSWVSSRTVTRELSMLEFVQTQRSHRTGRVCLFVGEDYHSSEPAKEYLQERLREMDGDPFKIGDATFADRKAKDDFDIFSVRLIEQLLPLPKVGKEGKYTAPSALGKSRAQLKEERDAVLAPIRKALMDRVEELKGVEWRVAGAEKSLDHWAYLYQLMTYLHEKEIVSQQTFERWEGEVAERVKVLEKEKMKKNLDNKKLYKKDQKTVEAGSEEQTFGPTI